MKIDNIQGLGFKQSTSAFKAFTKQAAPKLAGLAISAIAMEKLLSSPQKDTVTFASKDGGGSVCTDSYSIEAPDLYTC